MSHLEELKGRYPDGIPVEVETEALALLIHEAAERLTEDQVVEHVKEVHGAMQRKDKVRAIILMLKTLGDVGIKVAIATD